MNCQPIKDKKTELHRIIDSGKPGIILRNESWLKKNLISKTWKFLSDSFDAVPKDRVSDAHGVVFIIFKRDLLCTETHELDTNC